MDDGLRHSRVVQDAGGGDAMGTLGLTTMWSGETMSDTRE
jgi:hypothetical protein